MTWVDATMPSTASGNYTRFVQARPYVEAGQRGVDFPEAFVDSNPWAITTINTVPIITTHRNDPAS